MAVCQPTLSKDFLKDIKELAFLIFTLTISQCLVYINS